MNDSNFYSKTINSIFLKWMETIDRACKENKLTVEGLKQEMRSNPNIIIERIYKDYIDFDFYGNTEIIYREIQYNNQVIARMSRRGTVYKFEGFILKEND